MTSASVAVTLSVWRRAHPVVGVCFGLITLVFVYTTLVNVIERPDGVKIGAFFIASIVLSSLVSCVWRTTELRVEKITLDNEAQRFINEMDAQGELRIIANNRAGATRLSMLTASRNNARIITSLRMNPSFSWRSTCATRASFPPT
jgi:hypothetical protein